MDTNTIRKFKEFMVENDRSMDQNKEGLKVVGSIKAELAVLMPTVIKEERLDCFKRLLGLYISLNAITYAVDENAV